MLLPIQFKEIRGFGPSDSSCPSIVMLAFLLLFYFHFPISLLLLSQGAKHRMSNIGLWTFTNLQQVR